jgi:hypothetical protein
LFREARVARWSTPSTPSQSATGRWERAGVAVTTWLQGTSRDGDPHDHQLNLFARMVQTDSDGRWRALDTMALRYQLPAMQAIVAAHAEAAITREWRIDFSRLAMVRA